MIDIEPIFRYKTPIPDKLLEHGFTYADGIYKKSLPIMQGQFLMQVFVSEAKIEGVKVYEADTGEEYILVHVESANGAFVGEVREACKVALTEISDTCFNTETLKAEQTKRTIELIRSYFAAKPEFLWEEYPECAVFKVPESGKWFAIIMKVSESKIGLQGNSEIEIMNLKDLPEIVEKRVDNSRFFKAYHMNKKHWYTICLDGTIPDEELKSLIETSYNLVKQKQKKIKSPQPKSR